MSPASPMFGQLGRAAQGGPSLAEILAQLAALQSGGAAGQAPNGFAQTLHGLGADQSAARLWESRHPGAVGSPGDPGTGNVPAWVMQAEGQAIGHATPPGSSPGHLPIPSDVSHGFKRPFPQPFPHSSGESGPGPMQRLQGGAQPRSVDILKQLAHARAVASTMQHLRRLRPGPGTPGPNLNY